eukprot:PhM_4_TR17422/c2_g1_i5/m.78019
MTTSTPVPATSTLRMAVASATAAAEIRVKKLARTSTTLSVTATATATVPCQMCIPRAFSPGASCPALMTRIQPWRRRRPACRGCVTQPPSAPRSSTKARACCCRCSRRQCHDHQQQDQEEGDGSTGTAYFDPGAAADTLWAAHYDVPRGWSMRVPKEQGWATNNNNNNGDDDSPVHLTTFTSPCSCASAHVRVMRVPWQLATSPGSVRDQVLAIPGVVPSSVVLVDNRVTNYNNATNHRRDPDAPRATIRYVVIQKQQQQREKTKKQRRPRDGDIDDNNPLLSPTTLAHEDDKDNNDDDMRVEGLRVVAPRGDRLYDVTLRAPESEWLRMGPTLRAMENSFMLRYGR